MTYHPIYRLRCQDRIDSGMEPDTTSTEAAELIAAQRRLPRGWREVITVREL